MRSRSGIGGICSLEVAFLARDRSVALRGSRGIDLLWLRLAQHVVQVAAGLRQMLARLVGAQRHAFEERTAQFVLCVLHRFQRLRDLIESGVWHVTILLRGEN